MPNSRRVLRVVSRAVFAYLLVVALLPAYAQAGGLRDRLSRWFGTRDQSTKTMMYAPVWVVPPATNQAGIDPRTGSSYGSSIPETHHGSSVMSTPATATVPERSSIAAPATIAAPSTNHSAVSSSQPTPAPGQASQGHDGRPSTESNGREQSIRRLQPAVIYQEWMSYPSVAPETTGSTRLPSWQTVTLPTTPIVATQPSIITAIPVDAAGTSPISPSHEVNRPSASATEIPEHCRMFRR